MIISSKMLRISEIFVFILCLNYNECLVVSIGNYPEMRRFGVNLPECGLRYKPTVIELKFDNKCFLNSYPNKTFHRIEGHLRKSYISSRIYYGEESEYGEAPWAVLINGWSPFKSWICSGVLITFEWVLTAAHCIRDVADSLWLTVDVYAGDRRLYGGEQQELASMYKLFVHPNFSVPDLNISFDLGLFKLKSEFTRHKTDGRHYILNTICLPQESHSFVGYEYDLSTFFGFGDIDERNNKPKMLRKMSFRLSPEKYCGWRGTLCVKFRKRDPQTGRRIPLPWYRPCKGDSGGGLVQYMDKYKTRAVLIGTDQGNYGIFCNRSVTRSFFVPTARNIEWIFDIIRDN